MYRIAVLLIVFSCCAPSLYSQSVSQLLDIEGKIIRLEEDRDIIRLEDGTTYILVSNGENQVKINGEWHTIRELTEDEYENYENANDDAYWLIKLLPDFTVDKVNSLTGVNQADITISRDKLYVGFAFYHPVIAVGDEVVNLTDGYDGCVITLDLDLNYEGVLIENDLRFLSFDSSEDYLVMQFWMTGDDTEEYGYFGLDTLYDFDYDEIWHQPSMVLVVYDINAEQITHNWIYGSQGFNHSRKINLTQNGTIYTLFHAGGAVNYTPTDIDTVSHWGDLAARYSVNGELLWRTKKTASYDNFDYIDFFEADNGDYYLTINHKLLDTTFILQDTIVHEYDGRARSVIKYTYDGESLWNYNPKLLGGNCRVSNLNESQGLVSGIYFCNGLDSLIFLDSTYVDYDNSSLFFSLNAETGEELSSFILNPYDGSNILRIRYFSHDYENDKVYLGIESLSSRFDLFGTTLGHLDDSHIYFIELDMNFLVSTDDLVIDNTLMRAYPNPVSAESLLTIETSTVEAGAYKLYGAQGQLILSADKPLGIKNHDVKIKNNNPGVYFLQYQEGQKIQNQILIIQ